MIDMVSTILLEAFLVSVAVTVVVLTVLKRAPNSRLAGHGGVMLGRVVMDAGYVLLDPTARALQALRVTPNMITAFALVPAFVSAVAIAMGHFGLGALLATGSAFCDMLDGVLARRLKTGSDVGELFDAAVDRYVEFFLLAGLLVYFRVLPAMQVVTLGALIGSFMVSYATAKAEALGVTPPKGAMRRAERAVYLILGCTAVPQTSLLWNTPIGGSPFKITGELPVELAILIVAVITNASAVRRFLRIADAVRARNRTA
jgi:CDP-diacylglycerol---glycerol-3-phosphate 3-phosphatidyltransferase